MIYCKECGHEIGRDKYCKNCYSEDKIEIKTDLTNYTKLLLFLIGMIISIITMGILYN